MGHKMAYICLAQINGKWREKWHIKIYPKTVKRLKGIRKGSKTPQRSHKDKYFSEIVATIKNLLD